MPEIKYLSVSEYAAIVGKDPGNIRRMAISGRIPAVKIGKQWAIPEGTPFPEDKRVTTGKYKKEK